MNRLRDCYDKLWPILGENIEPYASVELVEKYRQYWKPDRVRILLLAESHVLTTDLDRKIKIPKIPNLGGYPREYAKFVYCLGCGEKDLTKNISHPKRDGTPDYWKMFYSCNNQIKENTDFDPILKTKTKTYKYRIQNKISLLKSLKKNGVWLVDVSIVALYPKPSPKKYKEAITISWENYTKEVVEKSTPDHVIIIGKGVAGIIETDLPKLVENEYSIIPQPNARLSAEKHLANWKKYYELCWQGTN